jgi:hypothetical protein
LYDSKFDFIIRHLKTVEESFLSFGFIQRLGDFFEYPQRVWLSCFFTKEVDQVNNGYEQLLNDDVIQVLKLSSFLFISKGPLVIVVPRHFEEVIIPLQTKIRCKLNKVCHLLSHFQFHNMLICSDFLTGEVRLGKVTESCQQDWISFKMTGD